MISNRTLINTATQSGVPSEEAEAVYCRAIEIARMDESILNDYGMMLSYFGRNDSAVDVYQCALKINPVNCAVLSNLGVAYHSLHKFGDAISVYRKVIDLDSTSEISVVNLAAALSDVGRLDEAIRVYRESIRRDPGFSVARSNLLFISNYSLTLSSSELYEEAIEYGNLAKNLVDATRLPKLDVLPHNEKCLRIGFVSGDFRFHAVGYFLVGVLRGLSQIGEKRFDLIAYSTHSASDEMTSRIFSFCDMSRNVSGLSDELFAALIRADGIDILIDLSGHSAHNRLPVFAWKPAPVQVSWLGYFATTGVAEIDYLIADPWTLLESEEKYFTEKIWRLPETRLCFSVPDENVSVSPLPALTNGYITFGCFNNLSKINDEVVILWAQILKALPSSRLIIKANQLQEESVVQEVSAKFLKQGISRCRLVLEGPTSRYNYFLTYHRVDIGLDPFPYPGGTTTAESLWMGVPVLTLAGERFLSRQGVGLLMNAGLPDWVAQNREDYVSKAVRHATELARLALLRSVLRQQVVASPIFDASRFARHFANALLGMWEKWCTQQR